VNWQNIVYNLPGVIIGLTLHEFCHAWTAWRLGDDTAKEQGRLSFNPLKHIDVIGFLFLIFAGFGWAKPVQFNPEKLSRPRRDKALIAAAGPVSNFLLALLFMMMIKGYIALARNVSVAQDGGLLAAVINAPLFAAILAMILRGILINLGLFIFNLIPVPPLDGSHILFSGLALKSETEYAIMKIGAPLLFIVLILQNYLDIDILPIGKISYAIMGLFMPELFAGAY
jgi:Zn-dependent protease